MFQSVKRFVDRVGFVVGVLFALAACMSITLVLLAVLSGCSEPRADFHGQQVTEQELAARVQLESDRLAREQAASEASFKIAVAKLDGEHAIGIAELAAKYDADSSLLKDSLAGLQRDAQAARASIEAQWTSRGGWADAAVSITQTAGQLFPPIAPFAGVAAGLVGLIGWRRNASKALSLEEALRAVAAGVSQLPKPAREYAKSLIGAQADASDRKVIAKIVHDDDLRKLEDKTDAMNTPTSQPVA